MEEGLKKERDKTEKIFGFLCFCIKREIEKI